MEVCVISSITLFKSDVKHHCRAKLTTVNEPVHKTQVLMQILPRDHRHYKR